MSYKGATYLIFWAPNITVKSSLLLRIREAPGSILSPEATVLTGSIVSEYDLKTTVYKQKH